MRRTTILKYHAMKKRFDVLHNDQRLRIDDVVKQLCVEFFMVEKTVWKVLNKDVPEAPTDVPENQLDLFPPPPMVASTVE